MSTKKFASQADLEEKNVTFSKLSDHAYAYTAEGDPNTGIVVGDDAVMVIDTQATPVMAADVIRRIREVTDKPIKYVVLSHYHAVRVLGASAYEPDHIIASQDTYDLIVERGEAEAARTRWKRDTTIANIAFVTTGVLAVGAVTVAILTRDRGGDKRHAPSGGARQSIRRAHRARRLLPGPPRVRALPVSEHRTALAVPALSRLEYVRRGAHRPRAGRGGSRGLESPGPAAMFRFPGFCRSRGLAHRSRRSCRRSES